MLPPSLRMRSYPSQPPAPPLLPPEQRGIGVEKLSIYIYKVDIYVGGGPSSFQPLQPPPLIMNISLLYNINTHIFVYCNVINNVNMSMYNVGGERARGEKR